MSLKTIVVQVDAGRAAPARLDLTVALAEEHGAHLIGIYPRSFGVLPFAIEPSAELFEQQQRWIEEEATQSRELFTTRLARGTIGHEWRELDPGAGASAVRAAYAADLVVVGQANPEEPGMGSSTALAEDLIFAAGRPVLVVPYIGASGAFRRVLVAWNGTREAARAVADALPVLARAEQVTVMAVNADETLERQASPAEICRYLGRHGIKAEPASVSSDDLEPGDVLLAQTSDLGADLIVMGAYGHSRLRETILGGVTRTIFRHMTVPVLMSH